MAELVQATTADTEHGKRGGRVGLSPVGQHGRFALVAHVRLVRECAALESLALIVSRVLHDRRSNNIGRKILSFIERGSTYACFYRKKIADSDLRSMSKRKRH